MLVDLLIFQKTLNGLPAEETVDSSAVNSYLMDNILRPILSEKDVSYGDIDFSKFEADDLQEISDYCSRREQVKQMLQSYINTLVKAKASACTNKSFC